MNSRKVKHVEIALDDQIGRVRADTNEPDPRGRVIVQLRTDREAVASVLSTVRSVSTLKSGSVKGVSSGEEQPLDRLLRAHSQVVARPLFDDPVASPMGDGTRKTMPRGHHRTSDRAAKSAWSLPSDVLGEASSDDNGFPGLTVVETAGTGLAPEAVAQMLANDRRVEYAHVPSPRDLFALPNDPRWDEQWALARAGFIDAWDRVEPPDAQLIPVAVIDSGVASSHPDLDPVVRNYEVFGTGMADERGHGTKVCGILAGARNNAVGISGAARCTLDVYKAFGPQKDPERYYRALRLVLASDVVALNLSLGGFVADPTEAQLLERIMGRRVAVVAAMGNEHDRGSPPSYPACQRGVIAVGATDSRGRRAPFSSTGAHIFLGAPGVNLVTTTADSARYAAVQGTSFAAPLVTAACALLVRRHGRMTTAALHEQLAKLTLTPSGSDGRRDVGFGPLFVANV